MKVWEDMMMVCFLQQSDRQMGLMLLSKDINFVGYTYKNFEIVNDYQVLGMAELKKKNTKSKRPTIKSLFEHESESSEIARK
ncbi:hypothetical protein BUALT_Bualt08G0020700 [Buddleja alternifolia]|uniref:Uncharacterized protein n=1 Tax=Buddleja alternifolia TaxID=168488 RepID=A0AAV6XAA0_9LAMI|nr:hypothetical protein BUALT_Bualt08G0020700 [Buddleja alternifolia]